MVGPWPESSEQPLVPSSMDWLSERSDKIASRLSQLYSLPPAGLKESTSFQDLIADTSISKSVLLASIPVLRAPSYWPLHVFYLLITELPGPWPPFSLLYHFTRLRRALPEAPHVSHQDDSTWLVQSTEEVIKESYGSISDFIARTDEPVFHSTVDGTHNVLYRELSDFIDQFSLPLGPRQSKTVVAILISDGLLSATICVAASAYYVAVPLDPGEQLEQLKSDLDRVRACCILTTEEQKQKLHELSHWLERRKIRIFLAEWSSTKGQKVAVTDEQGHDLSIVGSEQPRQNKADDRALLLFTKGIWGARGLVSLTTHSLMREAFQATDLWHLVPQDVCLSMVPAYDI